MSKNTHAYAHTYTHAFRDSYTSKESSLDLFTHKRVLKMVVTALYILATSTPTHHIDSPIM